MLVLSQSQAKNYMSKLKSDYHNEGCGCCHRSSYYEIDKNRILNKEYGEYQGQSFFNVRVVAKIRRARADHS